MLRKLIMIIFGKIHLRMYTHIRSSKWKIPYFKGGSYICCDMQIARKCNLLSRTENFMKMKYAALKCLKMWDGLSG
jgi:hypothetical protein